MRRKRSVNGLKLIRRLLLHVPGDHRVVFFRAMFFMRIRVRVRVEFGG